MRGDNCWEKTNRPGSGSHKAKYVETDRCRFHRFSVLLSFRMSRNDRVLSGIAKHHDTKVEFVAFVVSYNYTPDECSPATDKAELLVGVEEYATSRSRGPHAPTKCHRSRVQCTSHARVMRLCLSPAYLACAICSLVVALCSGSDFPAQDLPPPVQRPGIEPGAPRFGDRELCRGQELLARVSLGPSCVERARRLGAKAVHSII